MQEITKEGPGIIAMEDFSHGDGCTTVDVFEGYRLEQVLSIAECLADLHVYSIQDRAWLPLFPDPPIEQYKEFEKVIPPPLSPPPLPNQSPPTAVAGRIGERPEPAESGTVPHG